MPRTARTIDAGRPVRLRPATQTPVLLSQRLGLDADPRADPLSNAIESIRMRCAILGRSRLSAPWGVRVAAGPGAFYAVLTGRCALMVEGEPAPTEVATGEVVVVTGGQAHRLADTPASPAVPLETLLPPDQARARQGLIHGGAGVRTELIAGFYTIDRRGQDPLLASLPSVLHARDDSGALAAWLTATLTMLEGPGGAERPGFQGLANRIGQLIFIQALRAHVGEQPGASGAWLRGLTDPDIGPALALIHAHPDRAWTVATLAEAVGISRTSLAVKFAAVVGQPPLSYLQRYRMQQASAQLRTSRAGMKEIAAKVGYLSEAAFSNAFKRWAGLAPGEYRRRARRLGQG